MAIAERYEYVEELGRGSRGRVVACLDRAAEGLPVALKLVSAEHIPGLLWEVERLTQLAAPQLARVYALHVLDEPAPAPFAFPRGGAVLVQQHAEGATAMAASHARRAAGAALLPFVYALARDALLALRELHAAGFVHRDVKPDNLVVSEGGRAMLVDLELAAPAGPVRELAGSTAYAAPEAWAGQVTPALDVYALAASLFDVLVGEVPAGADSTRAGAAAQWLPRDVQRLPASLPPAVRALVGAWLDPQPERRPEDAAAALAQLDASALAFGVEGEPALLDWASGRAPAADAAARAGRLAWVGSRAPVERLRDLLRAGGVVQVVGAPGAGRSRLVREALLALQLERAHAGESAPSYEPTAAGEIGAVDGRVVHLEHVESGALQVAQGACRAAELGGSYAAVVLEVERPLAEVPEVRLDALADEEVAALLGAALGESPSPAVVEAARAATEGYAGRLCRALAEGAGRDPLQVRAWLEVASERPLLEGLTPDQARWAAALALWDAPVEAADLGNPRAHATDMTELARRLDARGAWLRSGSRVVLKPAVGRRLREALGVAEREAAATALREAFGEVPNESPWLCEGSARRRAALERAEVGRARGEVGEVVAMLEEAVRLDDHVELRMPLADALRAQGRYAEALAALGEPAEGESALLHARLLRLAGDRRAGDASLEALAEGDGATATHARALLSRAAADMGDTEGAEHWLAHCAERACDQPPVVLAVREAEVRARSGDAALAAADAFWAAAVRFGSARHQARAASLRAGLRPAGDARALSEWLSAYQTARRLGEVHEAASYAFNLGLARLDAADLGGALTMLREGARGFATLDRPAELGRVLFNWANAWLLMGEHVLAERVLERAEMESGRVGDDAALALCAVLRADLCVREGALSRAERHLTGALATAPGGLQPLLAARLAFVLASAERVGEASASLERYSAHRGAGVRELELARARVALARGDGAAAEGIVGPLLAALEREGSFETRTRALLLGAEVARSVGDGARATARLSRCRVLLDTAMRGLSQSQQARLRGVEQYARAFDTLPERVDGEAAAEPRLTRLLEAVPRLFRAGSPEDVGRAACELALELVPAERALWIVRDGEREQVRASAGVARESGGSHSASIVGQAWASGTTVSAVDAVADARFSSVESVRSLSLRSVVAVPVRAAGDHAVLYVEDSLRPAAFRESDVRCIRELARASEGAILVADQRERERQARKAAEARVEALSSHLAQAVRADDLEIVGTSEVLRTCLALADRVAASDLSVLVQGESGTGKELIARRIHRRSPRADRPFVAENCAALPETLLESALFGHVRGAFTGAARDHRGLFEQADGGTLFLDEVGEMSAGMQAKLLRVLETGEVRPVGGQRERHVDVRLIVATHRDLARDVAEGTFREDLFYRIAVVQIVVPPLRERREDIVALARHFLSLHGGERAVRVEPRALEVLSQWEFRGNVRELENVVRRALVLADGVISPQHFSVPDRPGEPDALDLHAQVESLQRRLVREAMKRAAGNQTRAAELLGISRFGLQKMLKRFSEA